MKKLLVIALLLVSVSSFAQLTLTEKTELAENSLFRARIYQALFSKANFWVTQTPANLKQQKQINFALKFVNGGSGAIDIYSSTRFWLANYNGVQILDGNGQPIDTEILNSAGLDIVFNNLAGVKSGDESLPVE